MLTKRRLKRLSNPFFDHHTGGKGNCCVRDEAEEQDMNSRHGVWGPYLTVERCPASGSRWQFILKKLRICAWMHGDWFHFVCVCVRS